MAIRLVRPTDKNSKRRPRKDLTGLVYGKLTVLSLAGYRDKNPYWLCRCECGAVKEITTSNLRRTESCGCIRIGDLTGRRRYKLVVLGPTGEWFRGKPLWRCRCDCGNERILGTVKFLCGRQTSCGCARKGAAAVHGKMPVRLYTAWCNMRVRCLKSNGREYKNYGGRGITVCAEWQKSYIVFRDWALNNGWAADLEIDRVDNDGNYEPSNCRWTTRGVQVNNRRCNRWITYNGETLTHAQWEKKLGLKESTIARRLIQGFSPTEAVAVPYKGRRRDLYAA